MLGSLVAAYITCLGPAAIDGDTLKCSNTPLNVRIWGIQAPERGKPGWKESRDSLQEFANGGVVCEILGTSYSRLVGQCYNSRLFDLGFFQIAEKHATEWCSYSSNFYRTCKVSKKK